MINLKTCMQRSDQPMTSAVADELVMFDAEAGKYYGLNDVATVIWNLLEEPKTVEELCDLLTEEFDVSIEQCRKDVIKFLPKMREKGLVQEVH